MMMLDQVPTNSSSSHTKHALCHGQLSSSVFKSSSINMSELMVQPVSSARLKCITVKKCCGPWLPAL